MALDAGSVEVRLGADFDAAGFQKFDRAIEAAERQKKVEAELKGDFAPGEFDKYERALNEAQRKSSRRDAYKAALGGDFDARAFNKMERELDKARRDAAKDVEVKLRADLDRKGFDQFGRAVKDADGANRRLNMGMRHTGGGMYAIGRGATFAAGAIGVTGLAGALGFMSSETQDAQVENLKLTGILKSMGAAAPASRREIERLTTSISRQTGEDDELVKSSLGVLATFKGLGTEQARANNIFERSSKSVKALSLVFGVDMNSAAKQLGKAMNDPVKGMAALSRQGITFTDVQRDLVEGWVKQGKTGKAQNYIMREIEQQTGKVSAEYGKSLPAAMGRARVAIGDLAEKYGNKLAPTVQDAVEKVARFVKQMESGRGAGGRFRETVEGIADGFADVARAVAKVVVPIGKFVGQHPAILKVAGGLAAVGLAVRAIRFAGAISGITTLIKLYKSLKTAAIGAGVAQGAAGAGAAAAGAGAGAAGGRSAAAIMAGSSMFGGGKQVATASSGLKNLMSKLGPVAKKAGFIGLGLAAVSGIMDAFSSKAAQQSTGGKVQTFFSGLTGGLVPKVKNDFAKVRAELLKGGKLGKGFEMKFAKLQISGDISKETKKAASMLVAFRKRVDKDFGKGVTIRVGAKQADFDKIKTTFNRLRMGTDTTMDAIQKSATSNMRLIRKNMDVHSEGGKRAVAKNFDLSFKAIRRSMKDGNITTKQMMGGIERLMRTHSGAGKDVLAQNMGKVRRHLWQTMGAGKKITDEGMGAIRKVFAAELKAYGLTDQAVKFRLEGKRDDGKSLQAPQNAKGGRIRRAAGGFLGRPGDVGHDSIETSAPAGSSVLNRHQMPIVDSVLPGGLAGLLGRGTRSSGPEVPFIGAPGEVVLGPDQTRAAHSALGAAGMAGGLDGLFSSISTPHYMAAGGFVRAPGDPDTTGGRDLVAASIAQKVGSWLQRYKVQIGYGYDPGGGHQSAGHNVTGTATDLVPGPGGSWDTLEAGLKAFIRANPGNQVLYGTNGVGTPYDNHGRGNHAHVEWGGAGAVGGSAAGVSVKKIARRVIEGPDGAFKTVMQGSLDSARGAAQSRLNKLGAAAGANSGTAGPHRVPGGSYDGPLDKDFGSGSGATIGFNQAAMLAEKAGLPGITYAQIAQGESNLRPGAVSPDGGFGLWQMTPRVQSAATVAKWKSLGSYFNPWKNALMAKVLAGSGTGVSNYYGTGFVTDMNKHYTGPMNLARGGRLGRFAGGGLIPRVQRIANYISRTFKPDSVGGYRPEDGFGEHSTGRAIDVMTMSNTRKGNRVASWALQNRGPLGLQHIIWRQRINSGSGWRGMGDRGSPTANHMDHPHLFFDPEGGPGDVKRYRGRRDVRDRKDGSRERKEKWAEREARRLAKKEAEKIEKAKRALNKKLKAPAEGEWLLDDEGRPYFNPSTKGRRNRKPSDYSEWQPLNDFALKYKKRQRARLRAGRRQTATGRGKNVELVQRATGGRLQRFAGGGRLGAIGGGGRGSGRSSSGHRTGPPPKPGSHTANRYSQALTGAVGKVNREWGLDAVTGQIDDLNRQYGNEERRYNVDIGVEEFVIPGKVDSAGAVTPPRVDEPAIKRKESSLNKLIAFRERIAKLIEAAMKHIAGTIDTLRKAIGRLRRLRNASKGKDRQGYNNLIGKYNGEIGKLRGTNKEFSQMGFDAGYDLKELVNEKGALRTDAAKAVASDLEGQSSQTEGGGAASADAIAAAARQQLDSFQANRASLFSSFGSNFQAPGVPTFNGATEQAAGRRYFGATGAGSAGGSEGGYVEDAGGRGNGVTINQTNNFGGGPADSMTFSQGVAGDLKAAMH